MPHRTGQQEHRSSCDHVSSHDALHLARKLRKTRTLSLEEHEALIKGRTDEVARFLAQEADAVRRTVYGNAVYIRGLIEVSNYCKNDCHYCGIRRDNASCTRYRLTPEQILTCADEGHALGFRTFVLQGGEDPWFNDERLTDLIRRIKTRYPDCAITLSLGERSRQSYQRLFDAGADRYLLRHETVDATLYAKLHPETMHLEDRLNCLRDLKSIGYAVGCGFMVGAPFQTAHDLAQDLKFIEEFKPEMCGIGPFIPHRATPFSSEPTGSVELTCFLLSVIRIIHPSILLPATTALGSLDPYGRSRGILAGANVVMPNLSPINVRKNYELYNNKAHTGTEAAEHLSLLEADMKQIGYHVVVDRGDPKGRAR
ncbi:MAG: [FeFe] hydrogenase H-cluster radical SAM maturase HydE [Eggerthellaceae bacterium]